MGNVDVAIRHRCAFEIECALNATLGDIQKEAIRGNVWDLVLEYKTYAMDQHMVQALVETWNPNTKSFNLG